MLPKGPYESVEIYLDTYFRLLREAAFWAIKINVRDYSNSVEKGLGLKKDTCLRLYKNVKLLGFELATGTTPGFALKIAFETCQAKVDWSSASRLMFGNLLCLILEDNFSLPIWLTIANADEKEKGMILVEICSGFSNEVSL